MVGGAASGHRRQGPPFLLRAARWVQIASTIFLIVAMIYTGTVALSGVLAILGNVGGGSSAKTNYTITNSSTFTATVSHSLHNGGFYPISVSTATEISYLGRTVGRGFNTTTIPKGGMGDLDLVLEVSTAPGTPGQVLLITTTSVQVALWVNFTLGIYLTYEASAHLTVGSESWNAPFADASVAGSTAAGEATVDLTFQAAAGPIAGPLSFTVVSSGGSPCGSGTMAIASAAGSNSTYSASFSNSCSSLSGAKFDSTFTESGSDPPVTLTLPALEVQS